MGVQWNFGSIWPNFILLDLRESSPSVGWIQVFLVRFTAFLWVPVTRCLVVLVTGDTVEAAIVMGVDVPWGEAISITGDGEVTIARGGDPVRWGNWVVEN